MLRPIAEIIRQKRTERGLSQAALAGKLGLRQSQISDFERSAVDPRLSTLQDVARVLDFELMLIPRHLIPAIEGLLRTGDGSAVDRPVYALGDASDGTDNASEHDESPLHRSNSPQRDKLRRS